MSRVIEEMKVQSSKKREKAKEHIINFQPRIEISYV